MPNRPDLMQDRPQFPLPLTDPIVRTQRITVTIDLGVARGTVVDVARLARLFERRVNEIIKQGRLAEVRLEGVEDKEDHFSLTLDTNEIPFM